MKLDRKGFLKAAFGLVTAGLGFAAVESCGSKCDAGANASCGGGGTGGSGAGGGGGADTCDNPSETIGSNHGHLLTVAAADVSAAADVTYHIMGTSSHDHTVLISAAMFAKLAAGMPVSTTSSSAGHTHDITVVCA
jgi:hypothetical protein